MDRYFYRLSLLFYDVIDQQDVMFSFQDVRKQQQMAQLTKERDHLFETIRTYRLLFETTRQLINEMQGTWVGFKLSWVFTFLPFQKRELQLDQRCSQFFFVHFQESKDVYDWIVYF